MHYVLWNEKQVRVPLVQSNDVLFCQLAQCGVLYVETDETLTSSSFG